MGNKQATYEIVFDVTSTDVNYKDITLVTIGGWPGIEARYFTNFTDTADGIVIRIPASLETYGPIETWVGTEPPVFLRWLKSTRSGNDYIVTSNVTTGKGMKFILRDFVRMCQVPDTNPIQTRCLIAWSVFVEPAPTINQSLLDDTFSLNYFAGTTNSSNSGIRVDNERIISLGNKQLVPDDVLLSDIEIRTIPRLSNQKGQFLILITLINEDDVLSLESDTSLCPAITSITLDEHHIIVTTSTDIPSISIIQNVTKSSIQIPNRVIFDVTYPSSNVIHLKPRDPIPSLLSLVSFNQSMNMSFLAANLING